MKKTLIYAAFLSLGILHAGDSKPMKFQEITTYSDFKIYADQQTDYKAKIKACSDYHKANRLTVADIDNFQTYLSDIIRNVSSSTLSKSTKDRLVDDATEIQAKSNFDVRAKEVAAGLGKLFRWSAKKIQDAAAAQEGAQASQSTNAPRGSTDAPVKDLATGK